MYVDEILKDAKEDLIYIYEQIKAKGDYPTKGMDYKNRVVIAGVMGAQISAVTKRMKIAAFLAFAEGLKKTRADVMTMTVGNTLAKELLGRSINKTDLMRHFTTSRTASDKVDVRKVVDEIMATEYATTWMLKFDDLQTQWGRVLQEERANFNAWREVKG